MEEKNSYAGVIYLHFLTHASTAEEALEEMYKVFESAIKNVESAHMTLEGDEDDIHVDITAKWSNGVMVSTHTEREVW